MWNEGTYVKQTPVLLDGRPTLKSHMFPGLWLDVDAILADDLATAFAMIDRGTRDDFGHADLVQRLGG